MNIFDNALLTLKDTLKNNVEIDVTYIHAGVSYSVKASRGSINWGTLNRLGDVTLGENFRDYIFRAELIPFEPQNGDRIVDGTDVFEAFSESTGNKCYRFSDPQKAMIRVYTRRVKK